MKPEPPAPVPGAAAKAAANTPPSAATTRTQQMLQAPLLPTVLKLAAPNILGLLATTLIIAYDGYILGRLGANALAGVALVLPLSMLMLQMSAGGMGGAVTAAVARALGAGQADDARQLAQQAVFVALVGAALFSLVLLGFGRSIYSAMGGHGAALESALAYSGLLFGGALVIWLSNLLAAVVRGTGNMLMPSQVMLGTALLHGALCPLLALGWGEWPGLGVRGAALSTLLSTGLGVALMAWYLGRPGAALRWLAGPWRLQPTLLRSILRVGAPASLSPVLSNGSIALATAFIGSFGTAALAGYGVAARLEYIIVPIAFGFGTALTALVATNMGAGQLDRALAATRLGAGLVLLITGAIGLSVAVHPAWWMDLFTADPAVREFGGRYLRAVGACYGLFGAGLALFFASQGAGRMFWPLVASVARLLVVAVGGWLCVHVFKTPAAALFVVIAAGLALYFAIIAAAIQMGSWRR